MQREPELFEDAPGPEERPAEIHISEYWAIVVKHRRVVLLCVAAALALAAVVSVLTRPSYLATVVLAAEREQGSPLDPNWQPLAYGGYDPEFLPTQTRLLKSREVCARVVRKLNLVENSLINPGRAALPPAGSKSGSPSSAEAVTTALAEKIRGGIQVEPVRGTNLLELSYAGPSPKLTADVANGLAEAYIDWNLEAKFQMVAQASKFLTTEIEQLKSELQAKEKQLLESGGEKNVVSTDPQANAALQSLDTLNRDYTAAVSDRIAKETRYYELRTARPETVADSLSNGLVTQLSNDQAKLERDYAEKLNLFKPEWPAMQQLKAQIEKGRQHLDAVTARTVEQARERARSDYEAAVRREESLKAPLQAQQSEAIASTNLRVEVQTKRALLDSLSKRQAETEMIARLGGERASNIRIVDRALPPSSPFKPSYARNGLLALLAGGAIGVGLVLFLSYLDRSLRTPEQVERYLYLPALGVIPAVGTAGGHHGYIHGPWLRRNKRKVASSGEPDAIELLPKREPRSRVAESYRAFRTALLLSHAGGVKSIVITSSFSQEGKTATAVNLAVVLGQLGKRVLLVDADLHRPHLHEVLHIANRSGLVSILAESLEPGRALVKTDIQGVWFVPAGPASPNPSGLLSSEAMGGFLDFARANFDYVVLDASPVMPVADVLVLGTQTDGVVLCVHGGRTPREQVARVRDRLLRSNVRILGVLINNLIEEADGYGAGGYAAYARATEDTGGRDIVGVARTL
jgi:succinoglycan biosynthesis transport protein ExoP